MELKDWFIPLLVAFFSMIGAAIGGWWSSKKRIGIEVLSKNRQEWINDLRNNIANFKSISSEIRNSYIRPSYNEVYRTNEPPLSRQKLEEIYNYLFLLLNSKEIKSKRILLRAYHILKYFYELQSEVPSIDQLGDRLRQKDDNKFHYLQIRLMICTQRVLKEEWERVKKGE